MLSEKYQRISNSLLTTLSPKFRMKSTHIITNQEASLNVSRMITLNWIKQWLKLLNKNNWPPKLSKKASKYCLMTKFSSFQSQMSNSNLRNLIILDQNKSWSIFQKHKSSKTLNHGLTTPNRFLKTQFWEKDKCLKKLMRMRRAPTKNKKLRNMHALNALNNCPSSSTTAGSVVMLRVTHKKLRLLI